MTPRDMILSQIHHKETKPVPYTLPMEKDVGDRLDAHYGGPDWRKRLATYIVRVQAVQTNERTPIDATYSRDPYDAIWRMDRRPHHLEKPPLERASFEGYAFPAAESFFRPDQKEKAKETCRQHKDKFIIAGLGWGLFEISWNLRGFQNVLMDCIDHPDFYGEMLDKLMNLYLAFVEYTADLPVDAVMFGDDWGDQRGVILGPERWRRFIKPRWAKIYEAVHARGKLVITHCCGSVADIMPDIIEIGLDVLESVQPEARGMNPYELKKKWGDRITFWGGLGSQSVIPFGAPDEIRKEVRRLCAEMGRAGGYILAPAKPLQPETPTENAVAAVEAFTNQES
ncbi:MAG: uroporphyrinogen decarboxylase family protein [Planctomycetota bacterium]